MDDLLKAIISKYNTTTGEDATKALALRTATPGGVWLNQAPQTESGTYIVVTVLDMSADYAMGTNATLYDGVIQFQFCGTTATLVVTAKDAFVALFRDNLLTCTNHTVRYARPVSAGVLEKDIDSQGYILTLGMRFIVGTST